MAEEIPFARLGIPKEFRDVLSPQAPRPARLAAARGLLPVAPDVQLGMLYVLRGDPDPEVAELAGRSLLDLPVEHVLRAIHVRTHPKVLEYLAESRVDPDLDDRLAMHKLANDRTVRLVARRAGPALCEKLCSNHERLLMTPLIWLDLRANANAAERDLQKAEGFLRMEGALPEAAPAAPPPAAPAAPAAPAPMDLEAEILAALAGQQSPALLAAQDQRLEMIDLDRTSVDLGDFEFNFADETQELSWLLTDDRDERASLEELRSMEGIIRDMSPGQKIKLAYLGNQESRGILIRDSNKLVAAAVVKSGRMSDGEGLAAAANRNLADDVIREIATNREWVRKYPFQVALVNNPKCPASVAMGFIRNLNRRDLQALTRNRNISSAVNQAATRLFREKFKDA
ncbi:hypothetical protein L6R53_09365 [Myxococcota bacterium]|nr:hypothetical protein [Myxococcota bacterium]